MENAPVDERVDAVQRLSKRALLQPRVPTTILAQARVLFR